MFWVDATFLLYGGCAFVRLFCFNAMLPLAKLINKVDHSAQIQLARMSLAAQYLIGGLTISGYFCGEPK
jgi:hypothetical protein